MAEHKFSLNSQKKLPRGENRDFTIDRIDMSCSSCGSKLSFLSLDPIRNETEDPNIDKKIKWQKAVCFINEFYEKMKNYTKYVIFSIKTSMNEKSRFYGYPLLHVGIFVPEKTAIESFDDFTVRNHNEKKDFTNRTIEDEIGNNIILSFLVKNDDKITANNIKNCGVQVELEHVRDNNPGDQMIPYVFFADCLMYGMIKDTFKELSVSKCSTSTP